MNNSILFSVLIPNYNNAIYLSDLIKSIINQTYSLWECVIVDDASTDNSIDIIKSYIQLDNRIKLFLNEKNEGTNFSTKVY